MNFMEDIVSKVSKAEDNYGEIICAQCKQSFSFLKKQGSGNRLYCDSCAEERKDRSSQGQGERRALLAHLRIKLPKARENLSEHLKQHDAKYWSNTNDEPSEMVRIKPENCLTCKIKQSKVDCLERLYEVNFVEHERGDKEIKIPACELATALSDFKGGPVTGRSLGDTDRRFKENLSDEVNVSKLNEQREIEGRVGNRLFGQKPKFLLERPTTCETCGGKLEQSSFTLNKGRYKRFCDECRKARNRSSTLRSQRKKGKVPSVRLVPIICADCKQNKLVQTSLNEKRGRFKTYCADCVVKRRKASQDAQVERRRLAMKLFNEMEAKKKEGQV